MAGQVICVSRTLGAGGEDLAREVSEQLGFRYVDDEIVLRAAASAGVSAEEVAGAEQKRPLIDRILSAMAMVGVDGYSLPPDVAALEGLEPWARPADYEALIRLAIEQTAKEGQTVIVAHAASMALAGLEGVLRVLVTASPETRAARLAERERLSAKDAERAVKDSDGERRDYLRRFYRVSEELPTQYDLVVNTDALGEAQAARAIVSAVRG